VRSTSEPLLALLQLSDSAFPAGTFAHSFGLEQLVREGLVRTPADVEAFVVSALELSLATADGRAVHAAAEAAARADLAALLAVDRVLGRSKLAPELRAATLTTGRRFVAETAAHLEPALLQAYARELASDATLGCHPVAFGLVAACLGVAPGDAAGAYLLGACNAMFQAAMRLLPYSHRDAQAALHRMRPRIAAAVDNLLPVAATFRSPTPGADVPDGGLKVAATLSVVAFNPLQEIASMRHARASVRLFSS
jgi:urease accessory protein